MSNSPEVAKVLLANGAHVDGVPQDGWTPLHDCKKPEVAKLLLANGAQVNVRHWIGRTALAMARDRGLREMEALPAPKKMTMCMLAYAQRWQWPGTGAFARWRRCSGSTAPEKTITASPTACPLTRSAVGLAVIVAQHISPPPPANSFIIGPAVINTHTLVSFVFQSSDVGDNHLLESLYGPGPVDDHVTAK
jgi:hypothetical protein